MLLSSSEPLPFPAMLPSISCTFSITLINNATDDYPKETTWDALDSDDNKMHSGGPHAAKNANANLKNV